MCLYSPDLSSPLLPDITNLGSVLQEPAVGDFVFPPHVSRVLPQQPDLITGVPRVPEGVAEVLARACLGFHSLQKHNFPVLTTEKCHVEELFLSWGTGLQKHPPSCSQAPNVSCTIAATACMEKQLSAWAKEKEAICPVIVRAQSEQRLNAPTDEQGQDWR